MALDEGQPVWSISLGGVGTQRVSDAIVDNNDDLIVVGVYSGSLTLDEHHDYVGEGAFLAKFSPRAELLSVRVWHAPSSGSAPVIAPTRDHGAVLAIPEEDGDGTRVLYVNSSVEDLWSKSVPHFPIRAGDLDITATAAKAVVLVSIDGASGDLVVTSLDLDRGRREWSEVWKGDFDQPRVVATDCGQTLVSANFRSEISRPGVEEETTVSQGGSDIFVLALDDDGNVESRSTFGGPRDQRARALVTDADQSLYIAGSFNNQIDFGNGPLSTETNRDDAFIAKF